MSKAINLSKKYEKEGIYEELKKFTPYEPSFLIAQKFLEIEKRLKPLYELG